MSILRRQALRLIAAALSALYAAYRAHPAVWRAMARNYRPWMGRFARLHAWMTCQAAALDVPAYRAHLERHGWPPRGRSNWFDLGAYPATDKAGYVRAYGEEERCRRGRLDIAGSVVDESSGSSGTPHNWVRGRRELHTVHKNLAGYTTLVFPSRRLFVVNAYSMGAWATGTNTGIAMAKVAMVKNTGPDLDKIVDTLRHFGPGFDYLVTAYPPFCKHLADRLRDEDWFDPRRYRLAALVGGEGLTEALRDYLTGTFTKVRSGYGASDLTIGMAGETTFAVWLRRALRPDGDDPAAAAALRAALLGPDEQRLPMVFQYNPLETYLETTGEGPTGDLLCTVNSTAVLAPRLRYNIGDEAALLDFPTVWAALERVARGTGRPELLDAARRTHRRERMRLPLLLLYGRSDSTVSFMGANIYPQDVEYGLYRDNPHAGLLDGFRLALAEGAGLETRPLVHLQLRDGAALDADGRRALADACRDGVLRHLEHASRDFAQAVREDPAAAELRVEVHEHGNGPFAGTPASIKNTYLTTDQEAIPGA